MGESGWITPTLISDGTATFTLGSTQVVGDAVAKAAWNAIVPPPLITQRQIRNPSYNLYNIVGYDPNTGTITLDRPWMEPAATGFGYGQGGYGQGGYGGSGAYAPYWMYQAYYPAPVADFKRFVTIQDFTNGWYLDFSSYKAKQEYLAYEDPQRTIFQDSIRVVPWGADQRPNSATLGWMLFELWPHQTAQLPYSLYFVRNGSLLSNPSDTVPYPLTDELVLWRAKEMVYEWKESQKGEDAQRGAGANWQFLMKAARLEYEDRLKDIRAKDRDLLDAFMRKIIRQKNTIGAPYFSAVTNQATV